MFWVISVYFNIRNTLPKSGTFLLGHPVCFVQRLPFSSGVKGQAYNTDHLPVDNPDIREREELHLHTHVHIYEWVLEAQERL